MTLNQDPTLEPIAIVGIGCRLAGDVNTPADFWRFLLDSGTAVGEVPAERWEPYLRRDPRNAAILKATTPWGSFLSDLPGFDAEFFGVSPREAELMDPQQRLRPRGQLGGPRARRCAAPFAGRQRHRGADGRQLR